MTETVKSKARDEKMKPEEVARQKEKVLYDYNSGHALQYEGTVESELFRGFSFADERLQFNVSHNYSDEPIDEANNGNCDHDDSLGDMNGCVREEEGKEGAADGYENKTRGVRIHASESNDSGDHTSQEDV